VSDYLLNPNRFCVTPVDDWPPSTEPPGGGSGGASTLLLQSWRVAAASGGGPDQVVVCTVGGESDAVGGCDAVRLAHAGASFVRNESYAWSAAAFMASVSAPSAASTKIADIASGGKGGRVKVDADVEQAAAASRTPLYLYRIPFGNQTVIARQSDFPASYRVSETAVAWVSDSPVQLGAWPLLLWATAAQDSNGTWWRVTGGPGSASDAAGGGAVVNATLGWVLPLPGACHWGLPSVSFDDPAFGTPGKFVYWRGNAWAPLAMLTYWALSHDNYKHVACVSVARKGLANSYARMWMETAWRPGHMVSR
jgi:hypothetical protein